MIPNNNKISAEVAMKITWWLGGLLQHENYIKGLKQEES